MGPGKVVTVNEETGRKRTSVWETVLDRTWIREMGRGKKKKKTLKKERKTTHAP